MLAAFTRVRQSVAATIQWAILAASASTSPSLPSAWTRYMAAGSPGADPSSAARTPGTKPAHTLTLAARPK